MAKTGSNNVLGLYVGPNQLEGPQDGAYSTLQNCLIKDKGVIGPRPGFERVNSYHPNEINHLHRVKTLATSAAATEGGVFAHYHDGTTGYISHMDSEAAWASGVDAPETWARVRFADAMGRCYATSDDGILRLASAASAPAGGLDAFLGGGSMAQTAYDSSGFLAINYAVLYRAVLVRKDYLKREIVGPGSGRAILRTAPQRTAGVGGVVRASNIVTVTTTAAHGFKVGQSVYATFAAGDKDANEFDDGLKVITSVPSSTTFTYAETDSDYTSLSAATYDSGPATCTLTVYLDDNAAAGDILRLYRSEQVTPWTAQPPEDVYQVYEAILTATDISNGYKAVTDTTPEVLLAGSPSYFSPSVEGEAGNNNKPPRAVDVCAVGGGLILSNLRYPHTLELRLLATGGSAGVIDATTITITDGTSPFTMTGETGTISAGEFPVYSGESVSRDIEKTAQALVDAINIYATNTIVDAYYISGADDPPGMIRLVKRDKTTTGFAVTSDKGTAWAPQILSTGTATASTQESAVSSCSESKPGLPDAHPLLSRYEVGEPNEKILRVLAIRDNKAIIIKERSVWLRSGIWPNIRLDLLDDTVRTAYPDTAGVLDGVVYVLTSAGVTGITESGIQVFGAPVSGLTRWMDPDVLNVNASQRSNPFAATDTVLGAYLLFIDSEENAQAGSLSSPATAQALLYFPSSRTWTHWPVTWTAYARSADEGYAFAGIAGSPDIAYSMEARGFSVYGADVSLLTAKTVVTRPTTTTITVADSSDLSVGDMLVFTHTVGPSSTQRRWIITAISGTTVTLNVSHGDVFTAGSSSVSVFRAFECIAEPVPLHAGGNGNDAQVSGVVLLMDKESFESADVSVAGGDVGQEYQSAKTLSRWGWGEGTWGGSDNDEPWGGYDGIRPERAAVPLESQRAPFHQVRLTVREAGAKWRLHGVQLELEPGGIKGRR